MFIKYCLLALIGLSAFYAGVAQEISWRNSRNWKLYDIHKQAGARYSLDTLHQFRNTDLNSDTMQIYLRSVTAWPAEKYSMWMGLYVATCEMEDKKPRKIIISTYGGFFYDQATRRYYQIAPEFIASWLEFLNDASKRVINTE